MGASIKNPTEELKKIAVETHGFAIEYIENPSIEIQKLAIQENWEAIECICNPSDEILLYAAEVKQNKQAMDSCNIGLTDNDTPAFESFEEEYDQNELAIDSIDIEEIELNTDNIEI